MILYYSSRSPLSSLVTLTACAQLSPNKTPCGKVGKVTPPSDLSRVDPDVSNRCSSESLAPGLSCSCGRRIFIKAAATSLLPIFPANSSDSLLDYTAMLKKIHPPRPDWYEEFYASVLDTSMKSYEAEIAGYKSELFANLRGKARKVLEIGIGTGPNLRYYDVDDVVQVFGVDPNSKMEKYATAAAVEAGLPVPNFKFIQAVGEALPLADASVDAIVGTLVLCSVKDVDLTLKEVKRVLKPGGLYLFVEHVAAKEGTTLRFIQSIFDPLQQTLADGCHLTRETGKHISDAGFSSLKLSMAFLSSASLINPHIYGIACK
ncbi:Methyltransferase type [Parasponia andersonii]|uniref:Methyltransferase type n=1 Tax=Parasponia andersonii TaxID=3476 RepID=A0A2P5BZE9_PARAD|nr:Methyltransferase type [Parasponia andersonii]